VALPTPEPGLVLNYAYLWHDEHLAGQEEGRKNRPSVIVLCTRREEDQSLIVTVLPITHSTPQNPKSAIEIPLAIKHHLGLDDGRSWIMLTEGNDFPWPGYDLRKLPKSNDYAFGFLTPRFFKQVQLALTAYLAMANLKSTKRE
jgi:PemK-like, MazF-like toxin of type II toxin-antitoxin system